MRLSHVLFGKPLPTQESDAERIGPLAGVPVLGLDALASLIKTLLLLRGGPQLVIVGVPFYLGEWLPERRRLLRSR